MAEKSISTYKYTYKYNTKDLKEDHYIQLFRENGKMSGIYYGTSDDFYTHPIIPISSNGKNSPWAIGVNRYERKYQGTIGEKGINLTTKNTKLRNFKKL